MQDATLAGIAVARDSITGAFEDHLDRTTQLGATVWNLVNYQSERSQSVSYLVSSNLVWDAEMILRSFYEANVKIWYICSLQGTERDKAVDEFSGAFLEVQAHKRQLKAALARPISDKLGRKFDSEIFDAIENERNVKYHNGNKKQRRDVEQRWSFSVLMKALEKTPKDILDFSSIRALEHAFGLQSHLLHADITALDLMLDRESRSIPELERLIGAHVSRIFSEQVCVWAMTSIAVWSAARAIDSNANKVAEGVEAVLSLAQPFAERFEATQRNFYDDIAEEQR